MKRKKILIVSMILPMIIIAVYAATSLSVILPAVPANPNPHALPLCNSFVTNPAFVVPGSNGTILVTCSNGPAMQFLPSTMTPSLTPALIGSGYTSASIVANGFTCSFPSGPFQQVPSTPPVSSGAFLNHTITFSPSPNALTGQLLSGTYNYCMTFNNAPNTGFGTLTVTWPP